MKRKIGKSTFFEATTYGDQAWEMEVINLPLIELPKDEIAASRGLNFSIHTRSLQINLFGHSFCINLHFQGFSVKAQHTENFGANTDVVSRKHEKLRTNHLKHEEKYVNIKN